MHSTQIKTDFLRFSKQYNDDDALYQQSSRRAIGRYAFSHDTWRGLSEAIRSEYDNADSRLKLFVVPKATLYVLGSGSGLASASASGSLYVLSLIRQVSALNPVSQSKTNQNKYCSFNA